MSLEHPQQKDYARSWDEVYKTFNQRNPDKPLPNPNAARALGQHAMKKLRMALLVEHRKGDI